MLYRYIANEVLKGAFVALAVLVTLLNFFSFTDELGDLGQGDYGLKQIFQFLALTTPRSLYELTPSAALLGSLVTLGGLANNRELVAMMAAGASKFKIIWGVLRAGLILALVSVFIGEYISPETEKAAQLLKTSAMKEQIALHTKYGFWVRDGETYINIRQIQKQDALADISIFQLKGQKLLHASHVDKAVYDGKKWRLEAISSSYFGDQAVTSDSKPQADWSSILAPDLLNVFVVRPENLSAVELAKYMLYLQENGQKSLPVELAFWSRIVNPLVTLVMLLVATPFVLTVRRETSLGQRIVLGVTFGLGFYLFDKMFGHFSVVYELNPLFAAAFPMSFILIIALFAIARLR